MTLTPSPSTETSSSITAPSSAIPTTPTTPTTQQPTLLQHDFVSLGTSIKGCADSKDKYIMMFCEQCGDSFQHYYDIEAYTVAMRRGGVHKSCKQEVDATILKVKRTNATAQVDRDLANWKRRQQQGDRRKRLLAAAGIN